MVRVAVAGAAGRMGREVVRAVDADPECELVGALDLAHTGEDAGELAGLARLGVPIRNDLPALAMASAPEVLVDFTRASAAFATARRAIEAGISPVIGTTGMSGAQLEEIGAAAGRRQLGAVIAPNFAIGAVLMMVFARQAARYMPEVEIIELHHEQKVDAPSGTAMRTAELILERRGSCTSARPDQEELKLPGARGGELAGVRIHSVRLPGYVAHQEVLFGGPGQTLSIRHDSTDRASFMPGVLLAIKRVRSLDGMVIGLENLLDLV
jgi:4-hydroxy-tetrahydrodipicolinate reductase